MLSERAWIRVWALVMEEEARTLIECEVSLPFACCEEQS